MPRNPLGKVTLAQLRKLGFDPPPDVRAGTLTRVELPVPPSTNNLFASAKGTRRRFITAEYRAWKELAAPLAAALKSPAAYPVEVWLTLAGKGINPQSDVANREKATTDLLVSCGVLAGDSLKYVVGNHQVYRPDDGPPRVVVEIVPCQPARH